MRKILRNTNCFKNELEHWAMSPKLCSLLLIRALYLKSLFKVEQVSCCHLPLLLTDPTEPFYPPGYINPICPTVSVTWAALFFSFQLVPPEHAKEQSWHLGLGFFLLFVCVSYYMEVCWEVVCCLKMWWKLKEDFRFWPVLLSFCYI